MSCSIYFYFFMFFFFTNQESVQKIYLELFCSQIILKYYLFAFNTCSCQNNYCIHSILADKSNSTIRDQGPGSIWLYDMWILRKLIHDNQYQFCPQMVFRTCIWISDILCNQVVFSMCSHVNLVCLGPSESVALADVTQTLTKARLVGQSFDQIRTMWGWLQHFSLSIKIEFTSML